MRRFVLASSRSGFTLIELVLVMGIMVLLLTLGVMSWRALVGVGSVDGAQNVAAAFVSRAREMSLARRLPRGVIFFTDPATAKVMMAIVYHDDPATRPAQIELLPEVDLQPLQVGVGAQFLKPAGDGPRYFPQGLILFDGQGQLYVRDYTIRQNSRLGQLMGLSADFEGFSHVGVTLYDTDRYDRESIAVRDAWLDQRGRPLYVNRYSGALTNGR